jgi:hypothetical protein
MTEKCTVAKERGRVSPKRMGPFGAGRVVKPLID